jgi:CxxC motif-containing protein (DUF1111 family)
MGTVVRRRSTLPVVLLVTLTLLVGACSREPDPTAVPTTANRVLTPEELERSGGAATVFNDGAGAFEQPVPGLSGEDRRTFAVGNSLFNQNWVTAPSSTSGRDGLGPIFNAQSCSSCHFRDGRGQPPVDLSDPVRGLLIRLSVLDENRRPVAHPVLGDQFQDRAVRGIDPEGMVRITTTEQPGTFADGTAYSLSVPRYELVDPEGEPVDDVLVSPRVAPSVFGVGLLEGIPAEQITAAEDPDDVDGDGISGRAHWVVDPDGERVLGRFGWKAAVPTVEAQNAGAFNGDIGITSSLHPDQPCTGVQTECRDRPDGGSPELSDDKLATVTFYTRTLAVPARRRVREPATDRGDVVFGRIGCASCHTPEQRSGSSPVAALADQTFRPYTDLLLHDMGPALADDRPDRDASGTEWRTPPLWGIGLVPTVNDHTRYLHDGRARNLTEAVLWHGGEAQVAQRRFTELSAADRRALLEFLESL